MMTRFLPHLGLGALLLIAALGGALKVQSGRLGAARQALATEQALHQRDIANFRTVQAKANADWQAELARMETRNQRLAHDTDRKADLARTLYHNRILHLSAAGADPRPAGNVPLPGPDAARSADRSGGDPVLLAREDAMICATNTARLQAAHDWAGELVAAQ